MLILYRPYKSIVKSVFCLSDDDRAVMKLKSYLLLQCIFEKKNWLPRTDVYGEYCNDPFVKFYYNSGKPCVNVLLEYYYTVYIYWLKSGGEKTDFCVGFEKILQEHRKNCENGDPWGKSQAMMHKMLLIKKNLNWYKRFFRKYYQKELEDYRAVVNSLPRKLKKIELKSTKQVNEDD